MEQHTTIESDAALVARSVAGESEAFATLWKRHSGLVRSLAKRFARQPADVDDLSQEIFFRAYRALPGFHGESKFSTWIYRIAINTGINFSNAKYHSELTNSEFAEQTTSVGPQHVCLAQERRAVAEAALRRLHPKLRDTILLNTVRGLDYEAVSRLQRCPLGTVRSRISRARATLVAATAD